MTRFQRRLLQLIREKEGWVRTYDLSLEIEGEIPRWRWFKRGGVIAKTIIGAQVLRELGLVDGELRAGWTDRDGHQSLWVRVRRGG